MFATACPSGKFYILHQYGQLLLGSSHRVEKLHHLRFIKIGIRQTDTGFRAGLVLSLDVLLHEDGFLVEQTFHHGEDVLQAHGTLKLGDTLFLVGTQEVEQALFAIAQRMSGFELFVIHHHRLAFELHPRWQGSLIDIAQRA